MVNGLASVREAVEDGVVITCTPPVSRSSTSWLAPGAHVTAVGSDGEGKQELDPGILRRADVVVDSAEQCLTLGELQHAPDQAGRAVELGGLRRPGHRGTGSRAAASATSPASACRTWPANAVMGAIGDRGETVER